MPCGWIGFGRAAPVLAVVLGLAASPGGATAAEPTHGLSMHGQPALPRDFPHLPYANPAAPKGGTIKLGQIGSFDSVNPFIVFGVAAYGIRENVYESLLARSQDEPFTLYAQIARAVEVPEDRRSVTFHLDPDARFSDGQPVTGDDVLFSWALLKDKGQPYMRSHYRTVAKAEQPAPGVVRFIFDDSGNREAPLLLGLMPILAKHRTDPETFEKTTFEKPIGSGPYLVDRVDPGRSIVYRRNPQWWGQAKPINRGRYNFAEMRTEYFRDQTTLFEAFKVGDVHLRLEDDAGRWADGYAFPAVTDGRIKRLEIPTGLPAGMTGLVFNTRRAVFADQRVRRALIQLFDFEWVNRNLYHGHYARTQSFFARSELAAHGRAADARERALLQPFVARIKPEILAGTHTFPASDGQGNNRANMQAAFLLLEEAGYVQEGARLVHKASRQNLAFELMAATRAEERLFQAYTQALGRLGIGVTIRVVDSAQRWARLKTFDFDMVQWTWGASLSPGNEQMNRWGVASADIELSLNYPGVKDPAVDRMIEALLAARERPDFISAVRALDRVLTSGDFVVPLFHPKGQWVAHWSGFEGPAKMPVAGIALDTWWVAAGR